MIMQKALFSIICGCCALVLAVAEEPARDIIQDLIDEHGLRVSYDINTKWTRAAARLLKRLDEWDAETVNNAVAIYGIAYDSSGAWLAFGRDSFLRRLRSPFLTHSLTRRDEPSRRHFWESMTTLGIRLWYTAEIQVAQKPEVSEEGPDWPPMPDAVRKSMQRHGRRFSPTAAWHRQLHLIDDKEALDAAEAWIADYRASLQRWHGVRQMPSPEEVRERGQRLLRYLWRQLDVQSDVRVLIQCARALSDAEGWDDDARAHLSDLMESGDERVMAAINGMIVNRGEQEVSQEPQD